MRTLAAVVVTVALSGCTSSTPARNGTSALASASASASASAPADTDCGAVVLRQGERLEVAGAMERACLESAMRDGRRATLAVTTPTVEGDPIVISWRLDNDGTLSGDVDATQDRFAGSTKTYSVSCGRITELPTPLACDPTRSR